MTTILLTFLVFLDIGLLVAIFLLNRKQETHGDLLADLTEERRLLSELRDSVKSELSSAQISNKEIVAKVSHIAAEAEQEVKNSGQTLATGMEEIFSDLNIRFEKPLKELARRQASVETLSKRIDKERERLLKVITRGESLVKFFDEKTPFEDVIKDLENKKYEDCRHLLAKGVSEEQIASELGMSKSEVRLLSRIS